MSIHKRLKHLEQKHGTLCRTVYPVLLGANGARLPDGYRDNDIALISFHCGEEHLDVPRRDGEGSDAFIDRGYDAASTALSATAILPPYISYI